MYIPVIEIGIIIQPPSHMDVMQLNVAENTEVPARYSVCSKIGTRTDNHIMSPTVDRGESYGSDPDKSWNRAQVTAGKASFDSVILIALKTVNWSVILASSAQHLDCVLAAGTSMVAESFPIVFSDLTLTSVCHMVDCF